MFSNTKNRRGDQPTIAEVPRSAAAESPRAAAPAPAPSGIPSIISSDMTVRGNLKSPGRLQVEGTVVGDIEVDQLVVADGAVIQGEINAQTVEISGALTGLIRAHEITLKSSARVVGDVYYEVLAMEPRAGLEGQCRRTGPDAQSALLAQVDAPLRITGDSHGAAAHSASSPGSMSDSMPHAEHS